MSETIFMHDGNDASMKQACEAARQSFKYFWRELSWERRRIVPGLDMSMVKWPFSDGARIDGRPEYEQMWVGEVEYDGEMLSGKLLNSPNWLSSVREGDAVRAPFSHLSDWMMTVDGRAYGGFTVNQIRAKMGSKERKQHDAAWGLDFGDPAEVRLEIAMDRVNKPKTGFLSGLFGGGQKNESNTKEFKDHPMCINMLEKIEEQLKQTPAVVHAADSAGWTLLHKEAIAGNFGVVRLLVDYGSDVTARTGSGRTAAELARGIGWQEIADYLDAQPKVAP
jgi:uncharacterized protein YegJ (DUF2314 family)